MRKQRDDLTGQDFGYLHVEGEAYVRKRKSGSNVYYWKCTCSLCGKTTTASTQTLRSGHKRSCGCLHKSPPPEYVTKHGKSDTRLYNVWKSMKQRCYDKNCSAYKDYGARGIEACEEWRNDFQSFYDWSMANGYQEHAVSRACTIDRMNNDGNYEPGNCQWVDMLTQSNNRRDNHCIEYKGIKYTLAEAEVVFGIPQATLRRRLKRGMSVKQAIETPIFRTATYEYHGKEYTAHELADMANLPVNTVRSRIRYGWDIERVVNEHLSIGIREKRFAEN